MAKYSVDVPVEVIYAIKLALGDDQVEGLTYRQIYLTWVNQSLANPLKAYYRQRDVAAAVAAEETARQTAEAALKAEREARIQAELAADAAALTVKVA